MECTKFCRMLVVFPLARAPRGAPKSLRALQVHAVFRVPHRSATAVSAMQRVAKMAMGKRVTTKFEQPKAILTKTHKKVRGSKGKPKLTAASKLKKHKQVQEDRAARAPLWLIK